MMTLRAYLAVPYVRQAVFFLLAGVALLAFVQTEYRAPLMETYASQTARLAALRSEVGELTARIDSIETYDDMQARIAAVTRKFEADVDRSGVVERLTELSSTSGTRIIHGANTFGRPRDSVVPVEQDLTIEGPYPALAKFLTGLDTLETLTLLRSVEISANPDGSLIRAKLKLVTLNAAAEG